ncbi:Pimeloyl-ACP methyl ester carboxylesterase [Chitinophaga ginsengisegetis]|uniref:Pimeloyl-ACP methyl ester carboxylesterase n=1 Tax=Chitinophaga ginsengisegetis TaxID=393003 RepID=A0A1T5N2S4_9BACT|nr:alpha/beta hydrolase [Chitinophaga ginsengisegetis]SKC94757.1 Pimeloyl-ACP methyl ester carboxylesterase [Chitinophaga ginsengisegetis]
MKLFLFFLAGVFLKISVATASAANVSDSLLYFTSFDSTRIHYTITGTGAPVLLVHGFIVNGDSWKKTALYDSLLVHGYKVITLDLRGNGASDHPHDSLAYLDDAETKDIMGLMTHLNINNYQVVGYSRGAIIVARLLVLDARVRSAVMGGMGTAFTDPAWPRRRQFYEALSGKDVPELAAMVKYVQQAGLDQRALAMMQFGQPSTTPQELAGVHQPVLVIGGDKDEDNDTGGALAAMMPAGMHGTVTGDHNSVVRAVPFAEWVLDFLQKH